MKQKVIHLTTSLKVGGAESLIYDILRHLKPDYENYIICFHEGPNVARIKDLGIPVYQIKGLFCKYDPIFCVRLFLLILKIKPKYILSHLWSANLLGSIFAKILRIPINCVMHLASNDETQSKNSTFRNSLDKITFKCANKLVCVSDGVSQNLITNNPYLENKTITINNGIDSENIIKFGLKNKKNREQFGLNENHFVIGCVARFISRKRHELLIESFLFAAKENPNFRLFLIGNGPLENDLKEKAKGFEDKVIFVNDSPAYGYYPLFDIFVLTSKEEGLSIALLEAMSFGLPCIITNNNKNHDVIVDRISGFIVDTDLMQTLSNLFVKLNKDFELRDNLGLQAKVTIQNNFCFDKMIKKYKEVLKEF